MPNYTLAGKDFSLVSFPSLKIATQVEKLTGMGILTGNSEPSPQMLDSKKMIEALRLMLVGEVSFLTDENVSDIEFMAVLNDFFTLRNNIAANLLKLRQNSQSSLGESIV